jgi:cytochrome P450
VPEPYSLLWGHLGLIKLLREGLPKDAHSTYEVMKLVRDWKRFFPAHEECPPLVYLDMWPFMSQPVIQIISPELAAQTTQTTPPRPRTPVMKWALTPLTGGLDLLSMGPADHKKWRAMLNPAFSSKNTTANIPDVLDQVEIFAQRLRYKAGQLGGFGELFTLYEMCVALTFDIIAKFTM